MSDKGHEKAVFWNLEGFFACKKVDSRSDIDGYCWKSGLVKEICGWRVEDVLRKTNAGTVHCKHACDDVLKKVVRQELVEESGMTEREWSFEYSLRFEELWMRGTRKRTAIRDVLYGLA